MIRSERRVARLLGTFGAALVLVVCTLVVAWTDQLWRLDQIAYDGFLRSWVREPAAGITVVAIDDASLREIGRWPWPRRVHADLIDRLTVAGAAVIGVDVAFAEPATDDPGGDAALARAIEMSGRVVLPVIPSRLDPAGQVIELLPMPDLPTAAASLGHTEMVADADGVVRRHHLGAGLGVPYWPSLALATLQVARGKRHGPLDLARAACPNSRRTRPTPGSAATRCCCLRRPAPHLSPSLRRGRAERRSTGADQGPDGAGRHDRPRARRRPHHAALQPADGGVEFHANVLNALLRDEMIEAAGLPWRLAVAALLTTAACVACIASPRWSLPAIAWPGGDHAAASFLLLRFGEVWLPPAPTFSASCWPIRSGAGSSCGGPPARWSASSRAQPRAVGRARQGAPSTKLALDFISCLLPVRGGTLWDPRAGCG